MCLDSRAVRASRLCPWVDRFVDSPEYSAAGNRVVQSFFLPGRKDCRALAGRLLFHARLSVPQDSRMARASFRYPLRLLYRRALELVGTAPDSAKSRNV